MISIYRKIQNLKSFSLFLYIIIPRNKRKKSNLLELFYINYTI